jgi:hypothetical protein
VARGFFDLANGEHTPQSAAACVALGRAAMRLNELCEKQFPAFFEAMAKVMSGR